METSPSEPTPVELKVSVEDDDEIRTPKLTFSSPISTGSVTFADEIQRDDDKDHLRKKSRKSVDESTLKKRKDTTTSSISNFIHRLTMRSSDDHKKEEKSSQKDDVEKQSPVSEKSVGRPDKLDLPEKNDQWFESRAHQSEFQTAMDPGTFWAPDEMEESLSEIPKAMIRSERDSELDAQERSLVTLLDEFRHGRLRALDDRHVNIMREIQKAHEDVTRLHLSLYPDTFTALDCDENAETESLYEQLGDKLYKMHSAGS